MRVLLLEPDLNENGAIRVSLDRAARWRRSGAQVDVLVLARSPSAQAAVPPGLDLRFSTRTVRSGRWSAAWSVPKAVLQALRSDVVVAGREVDRGLLVAALIAFLVRRPLSVTVHARADIALDEYTSDRMRPLMQRALKSAHLLVAVSDGILPSLVRLGLSPDRMRSVSNGLDVRVVQAAAAQDPGIALPPGPLVVATGRLTRQKGFDLLIRAHAQALHGGAPPHTLLVLGEGQEGPALRALADALGVGRSVVLAGFVANPHAVVAKAELFVLSSRWEGYSLGLAEAVCIGAPIVAFNCEAGPAEVLDGGRYGRLVPAEDVDALAAAMLAHLRQPAELRSRAEAGAREAPLRFDPDRAADCHLALLGQLAVSGRDRPLPTPALSG